MTGRRARPEPAGAGAVVDLSDGRRRAAPLVADDEFAVEWQIEEPEPALDGARQSGA